MIKIHVYKMSGKTVCSSLPAQIEVDMKYGHHMSL